MALWGNNDSILSNGTVSVNYGTRVVTGTGTTFGTYGVVGDVIRFGNAFGGADGYAGDGVIISVAGTTRCTIDSIAGLSGGEITLMQYQLSQSPKYVPTDAAHNQSAGSIFEKDRLKVKTTVRSRVAIGATAIPINASPADQSIAAGDRAYWYDNIVIGIGSIYGVINDAATAGIGTIQLTAGITTTFLNYKAVAPVGGFAVGVGTVTVREEHFSFNPKENPKHPVTEIQVGDNFVYGTNNIGIGTIAITPGNPFHRDLTLNTALVAKVPGPVEAPGGAHVQIARGIAPNEDISIIGSETLKGKETVVVGVADTGVTNAQTTKYQLTAAGWVGITTYNDSQGNERVKSEVLVAMSGIHTGNTSYPPA